MNTQPNPLSPIIDAIAQIADINAKLNTLLRDKEEDSTLLTVREAAMEANVHINTIRNLIKSGQLEVTYFGRAQRIERRELRKFKKR